jgi:hypothetical protein
LKNYFAAIVMTALFLPVGATSSSAAQNAASADTRGPGANTLHKHLFCVKNAESGACEDCWSDGKISSARGTCRLLKSSTNAPDVRKGQCSLASNKKFCSISH